MLWKKILADYFTFSKKDRNGVFVLLFLILMMLFLPLLFDKNKESFMVPEWVAIALADSSSTAKSHSNEKEDEDTPLHGSSPEILPFDPNVLSAEEWRKMGLPEKTVKTIMNYRNKGGRFTSAGDLQKIWGMPSWFLERVKNSVSIKEKMNPSPYEPNIRPEYQVLHISLNRADSAAFEKLPGIGQKLSARIVKYRDRLGGFHSVDQLKEVYGLADSVFQKIKTKLLVEGAVQKININTATKEILKSHPYFSWNLANAIVEFRKQHGEYTHPEQLKKIDVLDEETFQKILPYIEVD